MIYVETMYIMDGDVCPLRELVRVAKEVCPQSNAQFVVDEAHTTGVLGNKAAAMSTSSGWRRKCNPYAHMWEGTRVNRR